MTRLPVAVIQLDAGTDPEANIRDATRLADRAAAEGAHLIALPEYLQYRGSDDGYRASARPIPGPFSDAFAAVARARGVWILAGSLAESGPAERPYNTSILIDPTGTIVATYRKIHLFDVAIQNGPLDRESDRVTAGDRAVVADIEGTRLGLSICYDLRFPELYRALAAAGAEILAVPANFLERTGRDHWEVLLRARAIENAAYVIAPAQVGGPPSVPAHGRSMVIDPWGTLIAQAPDEVAIVHAELDLERVASIRRQIPVLANRRPDAVARVDDR
ncbi:MAG TPA: carbon-nitrogen hydrolase family protein [Verrucomicrobiae bacterium]|nr:carbon-nitrogen hydrolase family protein [Verrucomicrobiae bacterium]